MKTLYHIYNPETFDVIKAVYADEKPLNSTLKSVNGELKPKYDIETDTIYESATQLEITNSKLELESDKYMQRIKDGQEAYSRISAEFRLAKLNGEISEETHGYIEATLIPVRNEVLAGQWISAKMILEAIGAVNIGQDLYDRLHAQITNYINDNY